MSTLPNARPQLDSTSVRLVLQKKGVIANRVAIVGIRGYYMKTMGDPTRNDRGIYDDAFFVVTPDQVTAFNGNTDPSIVKRGMAVLDPGVWEFRPGKHKIQSPQGYPAFRQACTMRVTRDGIGTDVGDGFGINLHRGGVNGTSSEGCQTIPQEQWLEFRDLVYKAVGTTLDDVKRHPSGVPGKEIPYVLVTKSETETLISKTI